MKPYRKLRGRIQEYYSTHAEFAAAMGISMCALSQKLNAKSEWTADEMRKACSLLEIPATEIHLYFF